MRKTSGCALRSSVEVRYNLDYGFMCSCCPGLWSGGQSAGFILRLCFFISSGGVFNISAEAAAIIGKVLEVLSMTLCAMLQLKLFLVFSSAAF